MKALPFRRVHVVSVTILLFIALSVITLLRDSPFDFDWNEPLRNSNLEYTVPTYFPKIPPLIHQTWKTKKLTDPQTISNTDSWRNLNPSYEYTLYDDNDADEFMRKNMAVDVYEAYALMPKPVLKADMFRYAVLLIRGGVYSDLDTRCLRSVDSWTQDYPGVGLIVGIEADPGDRPDWALWYARHLQLVQWTIAGAPGHPVLKRVVERIAEDSEMRRKEGKEKNEAYDVMNWTGPGIWTDVVWEYLKVQHGVDFEEFRGLQVPRQVGDVLVLPITGFSPGVGHMGSKGVTDPEAKVAHYFQGSWKNH